MSNRFDFEEIKNDVIRYEECLNSWIELREHNALILQDEYKNSYKETTKQILYRQYKDLKDLKDIRY